MEALDKFAVELLYLAGLGGRQWLRPCHALGGREERLCVLGEQTLPIRELLVELCFKLVRCEGFAGVRASLCECVAPSGASRGDLPF